ncbi:MurT ligase domain-containing protein [Dehalobacter sp. DCM]|uniref:MurT ligase domain-containing protein n=1 Tax=Dehalobacter sp. DCM TaxID=2907827 RepID=UPI0030821BD4|nr:MurT ligase domain-containing protein [Dehalobacter sp. DCM]
MRARFWTALWFGKIISSVMKFLGRKGTTLPGAIALKICPFMIKSLASLFAEGAIIITGTNGKTTTNNLLAAILQTAGKKIAFNREGANMLTGITGALLQNTTFTGKPLASILLLEVDEATLPALCKQLTPRIAVITNFFRDQLDRYGELDTTIKLVRQSLPPETELILNADDPLVAQIGAGRSRVYYYGADSIPSSRKKSTETREGRFCTQCGEELAYSLFHYGQLGIYHCLNCGFKRPDPYIEAKAVYQASGGITFEIDKQPFRLNLQGSYNLYNALAAFSAAERMQISRDSIRQGLQQYIPDAGRMEPFTLPGGKATLTLVKNPTGFNQVIRTITEDPRELRLLIAINDLAADGRDISWLWDVDFEILAERKADIRKIICAGLRAEDMALRLKYAGFLEKELTLEPSLEKAVLLLEQDSAKYELTDDRPTDDQVKENNPMYILPTYTALFPMRDILVRRKTDLKRNKAESI